MKRTRADLSALEIKTLNRKTAIGFGLRTRRLDIDAVKASTDYLGALQSMSPVAAHRVKTEPSIILTKGIGDLFRRGRQQEPFDPNAVDGDGDQIVQEGTPFERPATPGQGIARRVVDRLRRGRGERYRADWNDPDFNGMTRQQRRMAMGYKERVNGRRLTRQERRLLRQGIMPTRRNTRVGKLETPADGMSRRERRLARAEERMRMMREGINTPDGRNLTRRERRLMREGTLPQDYKDPKYEGLTRRERRLAREGKLPTGGPSRRERRERRQGLASGEYRGRGAGERTRVWKAKPATEAQEAKKRVRQAREDANRAAGTAMPEPDGSMPGTASGRVAKRISDWADKQMLKVRADQRWLWGNSSEASRAKIEDRALRAGIREFHAAKKRAGIKELSTDAADVLDYGLFEGRTNDPELKKKWDSIDQTGWSTEMKTIWTDLTNWENGQHKPRRGFPGWPDGGRPDDPVKNQTDLGQGGAEFDAAFEGLLNTIREDNLPYFPPPPKRPGSSSGGRPTPGGGAPGGGRGPRPRPGGRRPGDPWEGGRPTPGGGAPGGGRGPRPTPGSGGKNNPSRKPTSHKGWTWIGDSEVGRWQWAGAGPEPTGKPHDFTEEEIQQAVQDALARDAETLGDTLRNKHESTNHLYKIIARMKDDQRLYGVDNSAKIAEVEELGRDVDWYKKHNHAGGLLEGTSFDDIREIRKANNEYHTAQREAAARRKRGLSGGSAAMDATAAKARRDELILKSRARAGEKVSGGGSSTPRPEKPTPTVDINDTSASLDDRIAAGEAMLDAHDAKIADLRKEHADKRDNPEAQAAITKQIRAEMRNRKATQRKIDSLKEERGSAAPRPSGKTPASEASDAVEDVTDTVTEPGVPSTATFKPKYAPEPAKWRKSDYPDSKKPKSSGKIKQEIGDTNNVDNLDYIQDDINHAISKAEESLWNEELRLHFLSNKPESDDYKNQQKIVDIAKRNLDQLHNAEKQLKTKRAQIVKEDTARQIDNVKAAIADAQTSDDLQHARDLLTEAWTDNVDEKQMNELAAQIAERTAEFKRAEREAKTPPISPEPAPEATPEPSAPPVPESVPEPAAPTPPPEPTPAPEVPEPPKPAPKPKPKPKPKPAPAPETPPAPPSPTGAKRFRSTGNRQIDDALDIHEAEMAMIPKAMEGLTERSTAQLQDMQRVANIKKKRIADAIREVQRGVSSGSLPDDFDASGALTALRAYDKSVRELNRAVQTVLRGRTR